MKNKHSSPAELRNMFGANLRRLAAGYASISDLSRQLQINRTQFNRYLSGESFPRPDVLARICAFFNVDGRVLLEPVDQITGSEDPISNPYLRDYVGAGAQDIPEDVFPSGFYRFSRRSFVKHDVYVAALVHIRRVGRTTCMRGFEAREAMIIQDLPATPQAREFRGLVMQQEDGIGIFVSRHNAMTCSFNYLGRVASFQNNYWVGYVTRTVPEAMGEVRATRLVYEYIGTSLADALPAAREAGYCTEDELLPFHRRLLRTGVPFS
jgi:transcriptional regulator with XRE-family HTH domain